MRQPRQVEVAKLAARQQAKRNFLALLREGGLTAAERAFLLEMGESLRVRQINPIWTDTKLGVICGHGRAAAAELVGLKFLDAIVTDENLSPTDIGLIRWAENRQRTDLTQWEECVSVREIRERNPEMELKELARLLHIDPSMLTRLLSPMKCCPAVVEAFQGGALGLSDVYAISKADDVQEQHAMLAAKLNGATRDDLERTLRRMRNGSPSIRASRLVIPVKGFTVTVVGEGIGFEELLDSCSEVVKEGKKAQGQGLDVKTFSRVMCDKAKGAK